MVHQLPIFRKYLTDPALTADPVPEDAEKAEELLRFVHSVIKDRKDFLVQLMNAKSLTAGLSVAAVKTPGTETDVLESALAVFACTECKRDGKWNPSFATVGIFIGWREALGHHSEFCSYYKTQTCSYHKNIRLNFFLRISEEGQASVNAITRLLGVDPLSLTQNDLDARDARFICRRCAQLSDRVQGLDWRSVVKHLFLSPVHAKCLPDDLVVLSDDCTEALRQMKGPYSSNSKLCLVAWLCNHCSRQSKRTEIIEHVKTVHNIHNPVAETDYFINHNLIKGRALTCATLFLQAKFNHQCLRCPKLLGLRLGAKQDMFKHLKDKHGVLTADLIEGADWRKVKLVDDDTWVTKQMLDDGKEL